MTMTRTAIAALLASTLLTMPAEAGALKWIKRGAATAVVVGVGVGAYKLYSVVKGDGGDPSHYADALESTAAADTLVEKMTSGLDIDDLDGIVETTGRTVVLGAQLLEDIDHQMVCNAFNPVFERRTVADFYDGWNAPLARHATTYNQWHTCCRLPEVRVSPAATHLIATAGAMAGVEMADKIAELVDKGIEAAGWDDMIEKMGEQAQTNRGIVKGFACYPLAGKLGELSILQSH